MDQNRLDGLPSTDAGCWQMAGAFTLVEVQAQRARWEKAYNSLATGKSYTMSAGGSTRVLTKQDLKETRDQFFYWAQECAKLEAGVTGGISMKMITPIK